MSHNIAPDLEHLAVPIDEVKMFPGNPRMGDRTLIRESLRTNGQYKALVVQASTGYICVGNNTWQAAKDEGWEQIAVQRLEMDDAQARKILTVDNRSSDAGTYDDRLLAEMLREIEDLDGTGYSPADLDDMLAELEPAGAPPVEDFTHNSGEALPVSTGAAPAPAPVPRPAYEDVVELPEPPATDAQYAETEEEFAARSQRQASQTPHAVKGVAEMVLVYPLDDRDEAARLIDSARDVFGHEARASEIVLRALRALVAVLDSRHDPDGAVTVGSLLRAAGAEEASAA